MGNIAMPDKAEDEGDNVPAFQHSFAKEIYCDENFFEQSMLIRKGMTVNVWKTLIVTTAHSYPSPDFIVKALSIGSKRAVLQHSWTMVENSKVLWSGTVAIYKKWSHLKKAADHIVRCYEDIQVVCLSDVVQLLVIAERSHELFDVGVSKVIIKGRRSFEEEEIFGFKRLLTTFGEIKNCTFVKGTAEFGKIVVAEYRFVTHAFVAKFYLNGMQYNKIGLIHAEIVMSEKENSVKTEVVRKFAEHINSLP